MHSGVGKYNESRSKYAKISNIIPQGSIVKAKRTQDSSAGDGDIKAIFLVNQSELEYLIDNKCLKSVVENGQCLEPYCTFGGGVMIQQEPSEKKTEQHDKAANQACDTPVFANDPDKKTNAGSRKVEQYQHQHKFEEMSASGTKQVIG